MSSSSSSTPLPRLPPSHILSALYAYPILIFLAPLLALLLSTGLAYFRLAHVPGPFLAGFSNVPRLLWVRSNRAHEIHVALHRRYGSLVRFGPNMVSVADPEEIGTVYGFGKSWLKVSGWRLVFSLCCVRTWKWFGWSWAVSFEGRAENAQYYGISKLV